MCHNHFENDEVFERIRIGAEVLAAAIVELRGDREPDDAILEDSTVALPASTEPNVVA